MGFFVDVHVKNKSNFGFFNCPGVAKRLTLKNIDGSIEERLGSRSFLARL
jgi:hypothetical protein